MSRTISSSIVSLRFLALALPMTIAVAQPVTAQIDSQLPLHSPSLTIQTEHQAALPPEHGAIETQPALTVFFAFDRADLTAPARRALDRVASRILGHLNEGSLVLIEGHADGSGTSEYNRALSVLRTRAVADYLQTAWNIPPQRLTLRAWGDTDPRRPDEPLNAENRRVEIIRISGPQTAALNLDHPRGLALQQVQNGYLDIDDFGGAPNPLPGAYRVLTAPVPVHSGN